MKIIREKFKAFFVLCRLIYEMIKNLKNLNDNKENNFEVCKNICKKVISKAKINCFVYGKNNVPKENCLIISNHISFFDVVILLSQINKPIGFAYASNLLRIPVLKKYITSLGGVPIHRDIKSIKQSVNKISNYLKYSSLIIFPEGGCSYSNNEVKQFQRGCFINLITINIPIVPVYLKVDKLIKISKWVIPTDKIEIVIGQPFKPYSKMTSKKLAEYAYEVVVNLRDCVSNN